MHFAIEFDYAADVCKVAAMLADPEFVRHRSARGTSSGVIESVVVTGNFDEMFTVIVRRSVPTDLIPVQARAIVGDRLEIRQAEVWTAPDGPERKGTVALDIPGAPIRCTGTLRLEPLPDGGTRHCYEGDVQASVPLVGSLIEDAVGKAIERTLRAEAEAAVGWLTERT